MAHHPATGSVDESQELRVPDPTKEPTISVEHAGRLMGVGRSAAYIGAKNGEIPVVRIGRLLRVPTARFLSEVLGYDRPVAHDDGVFR